MMNLSTTRKRRARETAAFYDGLIEARTDAAPRAFEPISVDGFWLQAAEDHSNTIMFRRNEDVRMFLKRGGWNAAGDAHILVQLEDQTAVENGEPIDNGSVEVTLDSGPTGDHDVARLTVAIEALTVVRDRIERMGKA